MSNERLVRNAALPQNKENVMDESADRLNVDRLWLAIQGMGVIDNGTWVSFRRADADAIAARYDQEDLSCAGSEFPHDSAALKVECPDCNR